MLEKKLNELPSNIVVSQMSLGLLISRVFANEIFSIGEFYKKRYYERYTSLQKFHLPSVASQHAAMMQVARDHDVTFKHVSLMVILQGLHAIYKESIPTDYIYYFTGDSSTVTSTTLTMLKKKGLVSAPKYGFVDLTLEGRTAVKEYQMKYQTFLRLMEGVVYNLEGEYNEIVKIRELVNRRRERHIALIKTTDEEFLRFASYAADTKRNFTDKMTPDLRKVIEKNDFVPENVGKLIRKDTAGALNETKIEFIKPKKKVGRPKKVAPGTIRRGRGRPKKGT